MNYLGLVVDITTECSQIDFQLDSQKDCFMYQKSLDAESEHFYVFDERISTCFSFDPRDEKKRPLY